MKNWKSFLLGIFFSVFLFFSSYGKTYYVSPSGNNGNSGTWEHPWATPGYASRQIQSGDTLAILGGRYLLSEYDADILMPPSGRPEAWTVIRGESGNRPVLAGRDNLLTAIDLSGKSYVQIENLEITHDAQGQGQACWFREGIEVLGMPGSHLVFQDLYIHHLDEFGMNFQDIEFVEILHCRIEHCGFGALGGPAGEHGGWRNVTIQDCSLSYSGHYYQGGDGSNRPYDRPDGFGIEPSSGPILIEKTRAEHNAGDGLDSKAGHTTIRQCIVANNACDGIKLWGAESRIENTLIYGRGDGNPEPTPWAAIVIAPEEQRDAHFEIVHVTVDDFLGQNYLMYVQYDYPDVPAHVTIRNSIFSGRGPDCPMYVNPASTLIADHNLFYFPQNERLLIHGESTYTCNDLASLGEGNRCGDPLFVRHAWGEEGDYHLRQDSPAIDAGTNEGTPVMDLEGLSRDDHPDMGAYEFGGNVGVRRMGSNLPATFSLMQNYPNPFNGQTVISFVLPQSGKAKITVYDVRGKIVAEWEKMMPAEENQINLNASYLPSGIYFCHLETEKSFTKTIKMVLVK